MAKSNIVLLSQNLSNSDRESIIEILLQSRKLFQRLFKCAAIAVSSNFKRGEVLVSLRDTSRDTTPLRTKEDNNSTTFEDSNL